MVGGFFRPLSILLIIVVIGSNASKRFITVSYTFIYVSNAIDSSGLVALKNQVPVMIFSTKMNLSILIYVHICIWGRNE